MDQKKLLGQISTLIKNEQKLRTLTKADGHEDIVAGVKVPHELKSHSEPIPYEHPLRETASRFVTEVHQKNRNEGVRMSQKYLGINEGGEANHPNAVHPDKRMAFKAPGSKAKAKEQYGVIKAEPLPKGTPQPALVSEPRIIGHGTDNGPKTISGPTVINSYKSEENSEVAGRMMTFKDIINCAKNKSAKKAGVK